MRLSCLYTGAAGLNKTTPKNIYQLLKNGWKTNSVSIQSIFEDLTEEDKISQDSDFPFSLSGENSNSIKKLWKIVYARFLFIDFLIFVLHRF